MFQPVEESLLCLQEVIKIKIRFKLGVKLMLTSVDDLLS